MLAMMLCVAINGWAQVQQKDAKVSVGMITGRVTFDGKAMADVTVALFPQVFATLDTPAVAKTITDSEGRFQLTNIATGAYLVKPITPNFHVPFAHERFFDAGRGVNIGEGEQVEGIDFALKRGAVITGRIVDGNRQPVVEEIVQVELVNKETRGSWQLQFSNPSMVMTDDRGVYRIYGLPPGHYRISVGLSDWGHQTSNNSGKKVFKETFYPSVSDRKKAETIELKEGEEASDIDITVGLSLKSYKATGRILDAETGKPLEGLVCSYTADRFSALLGALGTSKTPTNSKGEFQIEGILPGSYALAVKSQEAFYSESLNITVKDSDVSGIEVKVHRGALISGKVVIESSDDQKNISTLLPITLYAQKERFIMPFDDAVMATVEPDGSFRFAGVRPGNMKISSVGQHRETPAWLLYIENEGKDITNGLDVKAGDNIKDVRIAVAQGSGIIRGEVKFKKEDLPRISEIWIYALPKTKYGISQVATSANITSIDKTQRFFIPSVPLGEYEIMLNIKLYRAPRHIQKQAVIVNKGKDAEISFDVELKAEEKDKE
jgi:protocatechuate 3,4-dioxygenase beta subunit